MQNVMNQSPLQPRVAVVTGAGSGIGQAVAQQLLEAGWAVTLTGRRLEPLENTAGGWGLAHSVAADISVHDDVVHLFDQVRERWGRLDLLFNNAGTYGPAGAVDEISPEDWSATVATNLTGSFLCAAEGFRMMRHQDPQGGRIINNGSIAAHSPRPRSVAYTATKHAITGLTKSIELDGRPYGITCGQIDIGNTSTALMDTLGVDAGALQADGTRRVEPTFPVEEAARTVLHMAQLPASASIGTVVMTASGMPFIGRG
ncbi:NADP-dependent 3-hydroxy acid dehydrogenase YdfG [Arthrobacter subterraneus]|uniref:NADP-dependent 3-hydroxy acid dehydrogenase YdfG n=2 Tax=Arthrobacter subterraneus TaxID=335973 RepID=A0A1G8L4H0_9MICC|nr:NADP-dependent 3-hydroxy acid dehydrogenase YdfG [Arthrobacter subterraneus]